MTREERKKAAKEFKEWRDSYYNKNKLPATMFIEEVIKILEQEPSGETVSLEAFKQVKWERDIAIEQLKELGYGFGQKIEPSGSENPNKWIPVSERLPEKGQRVLASQTIEYGHRVEITQYDRFGFLLGIVDAWMPLPEPYEPQESEDKE